MTVLRETELVPEMEVAGMSSIPHHVPGETQGTLLLLSV